MAKDNTIRTFTAYDIERYHKGMLTPRERHDLEKAALDDPFLADALEGYTTANVDIAADLSELKKRLSDKTEEKKVVPISTTAKTSKFPWLRVAAMLILLAGTAGLIYKFGFDNSKTEIAQSPESKPSQQQIPPTNNANGTTTGSDTNTLITSGITIDTARTYKLDASTSTAIGSTTQEYSAIERDVVNQSKDTAAGNEKFANIKPVTPTASEEVASFKTDDAAKKQMAKALAADKQKELKSDSSIYRNDGVVESAAMGNRLNENARRKVAENTYNFGNTNTFRGRITDINNNPIPFANVTNTEDNVGTYADARGYFNLTSPDSVLDVEVRGLGFNNYNARLRNVPNNQVVLVEDRSLDEVVISTKKPNATSRAKAANMKLEGEPEPEDGWDNYDSYLANNLNVPEDYKIKRTGTEEVKLSFEVNKFGEPVNIKVVKSLCDRCDREAIRLVQEGPKWKRKGKKGRTTVTISF